MIDYGSFQFAAAPRTGTAWFTKACSAAGLGDRQRTHVHVPFPLDRGQTLRVTLVRHPCDWLVSYFKSIKGAKIGVPEVDRFSELPTSDIRDFVVSYLQRMPGAVGEMFYSYRADSVLRIEDMPWAFFELLEVIGVTRQSQANIGDRQNASKWVPVLSRQLRARICEAERDLMDRYDYF